MTSAIDQGGLMPAGAAAPAPGGPAWLDRSHRDLADATPHIVWRYGAADLAFGEELGLRIAVAVDNARLHSAPEQARIAAEAMAADVLEQSAKVEAALLTMRAERDAALGRLHRASKPSGT